MNGMGTCRESVIFPLTEHCPKELKEIKSAARNTKNRFGLNGILDDFYVFI
jgi:hypothetical protein